MKKIVLIIGVWLSVLAALHMPAFAQQTIAIPLPISSATVTIPPMTTAPLAPLATQLGQTLQTLVGAAPANEDDTNPTIADSFATHFLEMLAQMVDGIKAHSNVWADTQNALPDFAQWLQTQFSDTHRQALWGAIGNDCLIIIGAPLLIGVALSLLLLPVRTNLRRKNPHNRPSRVGLLIGLFVLRVLPMLVFLGIALTLLDQNEPHRLPRFVILNVIYALGLAYSIQQIARGIFAPTSPHLRLFEMPVDRARSAYRWVSVFTYLIVYGYFFIDVATVLRVPFTSIGLFQNLLAVLLTVLAIIVIYRKRPYIAGVIHGQIEDENTESFGLALRAWLSRHWHWLATVYLIVSLSVTLVGIENGFALLLRSTILSITILVVSRLSFMAIRYWAMPTSTGSGMIHRQILAFFLRPFIWVSAAVAIAAVWGFPLARLMATPLGQRATGAVSSFGITLVVLTLLYEMLNASIDRHLSRRDANKQPVATARARTLLPMVRNSAFILFSGIAVLVGLSVIGINIGPLLAGAGVLGVAVGFGSQTLVKDFLTGLFIVVENTIAVGDIVKIENFHGMVEALSIRTIRLRDADGSLHILPFSEVSKITNMSKGFAYALVDVGVSYESDLEKVMNVLREVGAQIQEDPVFKRVIIEPIEVLGVENLGDSSVTIRARLRTRPGKQFDVKRLLLLRIKQRFDKEGIEIPYPTVTHVVKPT